MNLFKMLKSLFTSAPRLAPLECAHRVRAGDAILVDVREPGEWAAGVAERAVLLSFTDLTGGRTQWKQFLADPIFQGLAISLLFGAIASLLISPLAVPLIYYMTHAGKHAKPATPSAPTGPAGNDACTIAQ